MQGGWAYTATVKDGAVEDVATTRAAEDAVWFLLACRSDGRLTVSFIHSEHFPFPLKPVSLILVGLAVAAVRGNDHNHGASATRNTAGAGMSDAPRRLSDGTVFVALFQNMILLWALASSVISVSYCWWSGLDDNETNRIRLGLARLFLALIAGAGFTSFLLTNYFLEAYFGSLLPLITFFHVIAAALLAFDLFVIASVSVRMTRPIRIALAVVIGALVSAPMAHRSLQWFAQYPGLSGGYVGVLKKYYMGKPILVLGHFNQLPTAITEGPTLKMGSEEHDVVTADLSRFDRFRNEKKQIVFLCLDLHWVMCDLRVSKMLQRGDELLFRGADFAFIGINQH